MSDLSRVEQLLRNALGEDIYEVTPQSRVEVLLVELNELIEGMGGSVSPEDIATAVSAYLDEHLTNPTNPPVDTSLTIAGAAADAKKTGDEITELKEEITDLRSEPTSEETVTIKRSEISLSDYSDQTALGLDGNTYSHANSITSGFIYVKENTQINVNVYSIKNYSACVCFYDIGKGFISCITPTSGDSATWVLVSDEFTIPANAYYARLCMMKNNNGASVANNQQITLTVFSSLIEEITNNTQAIQDVTESLLIQEKQIDSHATMETADSGYIGLDGSVTSNARSYVSDYINVIPSTSIAYYAYSIRNVTAVLAFYDSTKNFISCISPSTGDSGTWQLCSGSAVIPQNAKYIRYSMKKAVGSGVSNVSKQYVEYAIYNTVTVVAKQAYTDATMWKNKRWCAFGTSITDTSFMNTETGEVTGKYVPFLEKLSGLIVTNRGIAGGTIGSGGVAGGTSNILNAILNSSDLDDYDLITVEGFVNDFACGVAIGEIGDTENTSMYGAIYLAIKYILEHSHATLVFITESTGKYYEFHTTSGTGDYRVLRKNGIGLYQQDYNNAIIDMCQRYGVPVIDAGAKSQINQYRPQFIIDQIHHTELGGKQYANTIWSELKNIPVLAKTNV